MAALMLAVMPGGARAQTTPTEIAPVDVTARQIRRAARRTTVRPAQVQRTRVARPVARTARPAVAVAVPAPSIGNAGLVPSAGAAGAGNGERANGPVQGFVASRTGTATKTDTPILETPQSITVVTRGQIDEQRSETVSQALRYSAGVVSEQRPSNNRYDSIIVRGFGGVGSAAGYVNFWDGLRLLRGNSFAVPSIDPYSLERIEILRGPASVLFGQANIGGLVNLVSKRPTEVPTGEVLLQTGSYGRLQSAFDISGPVDPEGKLLYRFTGLGRDAGTQVDFTREERILIAPQFTWRPDAATSLTVFAHYQRDPETGFYGSLPLTGTLLPGRFGFIPTNFFPGEPRFEGFNRDQVHVGYEFEHKPTADITLRSKLRFLDMATKFTTVPTAGALSTVDGRTIPRRITYSREFVRGVSLDNNAQFDFWTGPLQHKLLVGSDYLIADSKRILGAGGTVPSIDYIAPVYGRLPFVFPATPLLVQSQDQLGLYAQDQIKYDRLVVTGGVRQDFATTNQLVYSPVSRVNVDDSATTGRAGAVYLLDYGLAPYFSYSTSFDPAVGVSFQGSPFRPTTGEQYEGGIKWQPIDTAFVQFSAFDLVQNNVLTPDPAPGRVGFSVQTGQIRSRGIEVEARASLGRNLDLIAAYSAADIEVTRANDVTLGKRPVGTPSHTASGWAYYTFRDGPLAGLGFGGGARYIGNTVATPDALYHVPRSVLFDGAVSYDFGVATPSMKGLRLAINATNLADQEYVAACTSATFCVYGPRRQILATLSYRW